MPVLLMIRSIVIASFLAASAYAQTARVEWSTRLGSFATVSGLLATEDGGAVMAYTSSPCERVGAPTSERDYTTRLAVAKIDRAGNVVFDAEIERPAEIQKVPGSVRGGTIGGIAAVDDGFVLAVEFIEGQPWMVRLDQAGRSRFMKRFAAAGARRSIHAVVSTTDGTIVFGGHQNGDFFVAAFEPTGKPVWQKQVNGGAVDIILDLAAHDRGGVVAAGMITTEPGSGHAPEIAVFRFDSGGALVAERRFAGSWPRVAVAAQSVAVAFNRLDAPSAGVRLKTLDEALAEVAEVPFASQTPQPEVVPAARGEFFVFAKAQGKPFAAAVDAKGARREIASAIDLPFASGMTVVRSGEALYVAWNDLLAREGPAVCPKATLSRIVPTTPAR